MGDDKESWKIPTLTRDNHEKWFRQVGMKLRAKAVFYTTEKTLHQFAVVGGTPDITTGIAELDITDTASDKKVVLNIEKHENYLKDEANALYYMCQSLDDDDEALINEYETAYTLCRYLQKKYAKTSAVTANVYMTKIQTFQFEEDATIIGSWDKLKDFRRKLTAADANLKNTYNDEALFLILSRSLPTEYATTIDTLAIQSTMSVDDKLKHLEAKEVRVQEQTAKEHAHAAFKSSNKYRPPQRRYNNSSSDDSTDDSSARIPRKSTCYLCDSTEHF